MISIPTIDLSSFLIQGSETIAAREHTASELAHACEEFGLFYITITNEQGRIAKNAKEALDAARSLFSLPLENDVSVCVNQQRSNRGYIAVGGESGSSTFELKEAFSYGKEWAKNHSPRNALEMLNVWPSENGFPVAKKQCLISYFYEMTNLTAALRRALSRAMGKNEEHLDCLCDQGEAISLMRCFHYFSKGKLGETEEASKIGSSPHTDWGLCTLIAQSTEGGSALQLYYRGEYISVAPKNDCLVANCGDYLSLLTKGRFKSPVHRVTLNENERFSFVYFAYPNFGSKITNMQDIPATLLSGDEKLSILTDQSGRGDTQGAGHVEPLIFGPCVAEKWRQVSRGS